MFVMLAQGVRDQSRGKMIGLKTAKEMATAKNTVMSARAMFLAMGVAN